jgi:hypothetical protein
MHRRRRRRRWKYKILIYCLFLLLLLFFFKGSLAGQMREIRGAGSDCFTWGVSGIVVLIGEGADEGGKIGPRTGKAVGMGSPGKRHHSKKIQHQEFYLKTYLRSDSELKNHKWQWNGSGLGYSRITTHKLLLWSHAKTQ